MSDDTDRGSVKVISSQSAWGHVRAEAWLLIVLVVPVALAAAPLRGEVRFRDAQLQGEASLETPVGLLDLVEAVRAGEPIELTWGSAEGRESVTHLRKANGTTVVVITGADNRSIRTGPATASSISCGGDCTFLLSVDGRGFFAVRGRVSDEIAVTLREEDGAARTRFPISGTFWLPAERAGIEVSPRGLQVPDATFLGGGRVQVLLWDAHVVVTEAGAATETWHTGDTVTPDPSTGGLVLDIRRSFIHLTLEDAALRTPSGSRATLVSPELRATLEGGLSSDAADGYAAIRERRVELEDDALRVTGRLAPTIRATPEGLHAALAGDADELVVAGQAIRPAAAAVASRSVAPAAAIVAVLVALALAREAIVAFLYSRIRAGGVLGNANRQKVYRLVCETPGRTVTELQSHTGLSQAVVRHHLKMLEMHGLVVTRMDGRARLAYPSASRTPLEALIALRDPTRARVAQAILDTGLATQRDIIERTGLRQRLVSYHVARLEKDGLVSGSLGRPRVFEASATLRELLRS